MPAPSRRGLDSPSSPIRKLVPYADAARARGVNVLHLNIGQPDIETPAVMRAALTDYHDTVIAYGPSGGDAPFREALFAYYRRLGHELAPSDLIVTTGGSEAVFFALAACLDPGDEIAIPDPMYANYIGYAQLLGIVVRPIPTAVETGYHLPEDLDAWIGPKTRAVLICNPSNPTGAVYTDAEMQSVVDLCARRDLFLIADEVYREFVYEGALPQSVLAYPALGDRAVVVDSLSKRYSLCGARIGCLVSRHSGVMASSMKFAQARLSPPALAQVVGARATSLAPDFFDVARDEYRRRRDTVFEGLKAIPGVLAHRPEGAFYQMARLPIDDGDTFVRFMLESFSSGGQTVMVAPGAGFYAEPGRGADEVRIAYVLNTADLALSMRLLGEGLEVYPGRRR